MYAKFLEKLNVRVHVRGYEIFVFRKRLPTYLMEEPLWHSGLGNCIACKNFTVQTLMWSLEFVIHKNLEHDTVAVSILTRN